MTLTVKLKNKSYPIHIKNQLLNIINHYISNYQKILIVTDNGVPKTYLESLLKQFPQAFVCILKKGEIHKNFKSVTFILQTLFNHNFNKDDTIIALGGGVVIDISAFAASIFKRGISYYTIPTTLLAQVDSCVGGKTGVDFCDIKNGIGTFYHPNAIFIDPIVLNTLTKRQFNNGLIEALKIGLIMDTKLFELIESKNIQQNIEQIIYLSLKNKIKIIQQDPYDNGIRQILNYGHTIGHAIESVLHFKTILHGEAVAMGLLIETKNQNIKKRIYKIYKKIHLKRFPVIEWSSCIPFILKDKKMTKDYLTTIHLTDVGVHQIKKISITNYLKEIGDDVHEQFLQK